MNVTLTQQVSTNEFRNEYLSATTVYGRNSNTRGWLLIYTVAKHYRKQNYLGNTSKSKSYDLLRTEINIEHKIFYQLKHDQN